MKKKKKKSILELQAIRFKNKKKMRLLKTSIFFASVIALILVSKSFIDSSLQDTKPKPKVEYFFSIHFEDNQKEDVNLKNKIYTKLKKELVERVGPLRSLVRETKNQFSLDWLHLIKVSDSHYQVFIKRHLPVLRLDASSRVCLISHSKLIYECNLKRENDDDYADLPTLKVANLGEATPALIEKALDVLRSSKTSHYEVDYIEANLPRGFLIKLKNQSFMLFVGLSNFDKKFKRLSELVKSQKNSLPQIELIELDYNDKAILKKRL